MNYCSQCGEKLLTNAKFCASCGAKVTASMSPTEAFQEEPPSAARNLSNTTERRRSQEARATEPEPKRAKKNLKPLFALSTAVVLFLAVATVAYGIIFKKTPKEVYLAAEVNSFQDVNESFKEVYGDYWELNKHMSENAYRTETSISGGVNGMNIPEIAELNYYLQNSSLEVTTSQDPNNAKGMASLSILLNGSNVFEGEVFQSDDQTGLSIPLLYNEYFYLNNNEFGEWMRAMDPYYVGPEELENFTEYMTNSDAYREEFLKHGSDYLTYITSQLKEENFTLEEDVSFQGEKYRKVTLHLSEREVISLIDGFLGKLANDDELLELFFEQINDSISNGYEDVLSTPEMKEEFRYAIREMQDGLRYMSIPDGFTSELIVNRKNEVVNRTTSLSLGNDYEVINFVYESTNLKEASTKELTVTPSDASMGKFNVSWDSTKESNNTITSGRATLIDYGEVVFDIGIDLDTTEDGNTKETDFDLFFGGYEFADEMPSINGTLKQTVDQNLKRNYSNQNVDFTLNFSINDYYYGYQELGLNLVVDSETEFTNDLNFPNLSTSTATNVLALNENDWMMIAEEISYNFQNIFYDLYY